MVVLPPLAVAVVAQGFPVLAEMLLAERLARLAQIMAQ
jgi:hypothetical protein